MRSSFSVFASVTEDRRRWTPSIKAAIICENTDFATKDIFASKDVFTDFAQAKMPKVKGNIRFNADVFLDRDSFRYLKNRRYKGRFYLRCILFPSCFGRAVCVEETGIVTPTRAHNHEVAAYPQTTDLRNCLKEAAGAEIGSTSNNAIFRQITRHHTQGALVGFP